MISDFLIKQKLRIRWISMVGFFAMVVLLTLSSAAVAQVSSAEKLLLEKAQYWQDRGDSDVAIKVLHKLLTHNPDSAEGRMQLGIIQARQGHNEAAKRQLEILRKGHPGYKGIITLERALAGGLGKDDALIRARKLSSQHKRREAVAEYKRYFGDRKPSGELALEYYQVASGLPENWQESRLGLESMIRSNPKNIKYKLALAKLLTYREKTRRKGISMLLPLSDASNLTVRGEARAQWRQALLWLPVKKSNIPAYKRYLKAVGADPDISNLISQSRKVRLNAVDRRKRHISGKRKQAFRWMNQGKTYKAEKAFRTLLHSNRNDADSNAGLGLTLLQQKKYAAAASYLDKAIRLSPSKRKAWMPSLIRARHQAVLDDVNVLEKKGKIDEAAVKMKQAIGLYPEKRSVWTLRLAQLQANQSYSDALASSLRHLKAKPDRRGTSQLFVEVYKKSAKTEENKAMLDQAINILEKALFDHPDNSSVRFNLARLYAFVGQTDKAISLLELMTQLNPNRYDAYYTKALFYAQLKRWSDASTAINAIPVNRRTARVTKLARRINTHVRIERALALHREGRQHEASRILEPLSTVIDKDNFYMIANAWKGIGDTNRALRITSDIMRKRPANDYGIRLFYISLLSLGNHDAELNIWLRQMNAKRSEMTGKEQTDLDHLRRAYAIRKSDLLRQQGKYADAWEQLAPYLINKPVDTQVLLMLAQIYRSSGRDDETASIYKNLLQRDPDNKNVIESYARVAIARRNYDMAEKLVDRGISLTSKSERFYLLKGDLEKTRGNYQRAMASYGEAKRISRQHIFAAGSGRADVLPGSGERNPFRRKPENAAIQIRNGQLPPGVGYENSGSSGFHAVTRSHLAESVKSTVRRPVLTLEDRINEIRARQSTRVDIGMDVRQRSGERGLSLLSDIETPMRVRFAAGDGHISLKLTPVLLSAGGLDLANRNVAARFGSFAINAPLPQNRIIKQSASGMAVQLVYRNNWINADIGVSPLGFNIVNFVGGLKLTLHPQEKVHIDVSGSSRSMTDSLLSYAGNVDEPTGLKWGGVVRTQGAVGFGYDDSSFGLYGDFSAALLTGKNVKRNSSLSLSSGAYGVLINDDAKKITLGFNLRVLGYTNNLDHFTFGSGGYFSPQQYVSVAIPLNVSGRMDRLSYNFNGYLGIQSFQSDSAPYYPNTPVFQAISGKMFPAIHKTGALFGIKSNVEYQLSSKIKTGALFELDNAQDFTSYSIGIFMKYSFDSQMPRFDFNVSPLRGYYLEGFR